MLQTTTADDRYSAAAVAKTASTFATATNSPPRAGPTNEPMLSTAPVLAFAAESSAGERASCGKRAAWAGPNGVAESVATTARA